MTSGSDRGCEPFRFRRPEESIESVKAQCRYLSGSRDPSLDVSRFGERSARALLIAVEYIEGMKARDAEATAQLVKMGLDAAEDGEKAQAIHDAALSKIAAAFR